MKKINTKMIVENWRKFLAEGPGDYGFDHDPEDPPPEGEILESDPDLLGEPIEDEEGDFNA